jgi:hypothetical protein
MNRNKPFLNASLQKAAEVTGEAEDSSAIACIAQVKTVVTKILRACKMWQSQTAEC